MRKPRARGPWPRRLRSPARRTAVAQRSIQSGDIRAAARARPAPRWRGWRRRAPEAPSTSTTVEPHVASSTQPRQHRGAAHRDSAITVIQTRHAMPHVPPPTPQSRNRDGRPRQQPMRTGADRAPTARRHRRAASRRSAIREQGSEDQAVFLGRRRRTWAPPSIRQSASANRTAIMKVGIVPEVDEALLAHVGAG